MLKLNKKQNWKKEYRTNVVSLERNETILEGVFVKDAMTPISRGIKRFCDMLLSMMLMIVCAPAFLIIYFIVKAEDGESAIYSQWRIGKYGRPFKIYKFRTMHKNAESVGPQLSVSLDSESSDDRLTKVGRFLRTYHLDELPQLWNVLKGDMSFVGYRPERKFFIDQIMEHDKRYVYLYQSRPGVTSYATLYNGYTDTMEKMLRRLEYDLYYLEKRSLLLDIRIMWLTLWGVLSGRKF